ncbi:MAG: GGDEF domain-containing protein [Spirochaetales bacterium]|nr:GGDEF domain-containing protein [Spirochaetales bacterium]MCF7939399.1 GGDEF domain-containing protein [Spirochaetales bacterium]
MRAALRRRVQSALFLLALIFLPLVFLSCINPINFNFEREAEAEKGFFDLQNRPDTDGHVVKLDGEWEFYWNQLLEPEDFDRNSRENLVQPASGKDTQKQNKPSFNGYITLPGIWNGYTIPDGKTSSPLKLNGFGHATYRLVINLADNADGNPGRTIYGLKFTEIDTAYSVWVNGKHLLQNGTVGTSRETMTPSWHRREGYFETDSQKIEILMQVSNYYHRKGGAEEAITFGKAGDIARYTAGNHGIQYFLFGSIMLLGAYHFILFLYRKENKTYLYFSLVCFAIALRSICSGEKLLLLFLPSLPWIPMIRTEYIILLLILPALAHFYHSIFRTSLSKYFLFIFDLASVGMVVFVLAAPPDLFTWITYPYQICLLVYAAYVISALVRETIKGRDGAGILLFGTVFLVLAGINDIAYNNMLINTSYLFPLGVSTGIIILVFSHTVYIAGQFSRAFKKAEEFSVNMERKVEERTAELKRKQRKLEKLAREDTLTKLYNRRLILELLEDSFQRYQRYNTIFSIFILDLDDFKKVNDNYGHLTGDAVLRKLGTIFRNGLRESDIAGRFGGEEFLVLLPETKADGAHVAAETIRTTLAQHRFEASGTQFTVTCSIGISQIRKTHSAFTALLAEADSAMYRAKEEGRNRTYIFAT